MQFVTKLVLRRTSPDFSAMELSGCTGSCRLEKQRELSMFLFIVDIPFMATPGMMNLPRYGFVALRSPKTILMVNCF